MTVAPPSPAGGRGAGGEGGRRPVREGQKTGLARSLRRTANAPEQKAWGVLRQFRKEGLPVRRQHPIGPYVADFAIVSQRLVIEIDGGIHHLRQEEDAEREAAIRALGWRIVRLNAKEARSADFVLSVVRTALAETATLTPGPSPASGRGERSHQ